MPSASVIIPAYNAEKYIADALDSVFRQTFQDFEVLVVDDGSVDGTAKLVKTRFPRVRFISQQNAGASSARNRGVQMASGEFIAFLDSDDVWHPQKLQAQVALMKRYPAAVLCRTAWIEEPLAVPAPLFDQPDSELPDHFLVDEFAPSFLAPYFATSTVMIRRGSFQDVGGFDANLNIAEDIDLYLRILAEAPLVPVVSKPALFKRPLPDSLGADSEAGYVKLLEVYHRFLEHRPQIAKQLGRAVINQGIATLWALYAGTLFQNGRRSQALKSAVRSICTTPSRLGFRVLIRALLP